MLLSHVLMIGLVATALLHHFHKFAGKEVLVLLWWCFCVSLGLIDLIDIDLSWLTGHGWGLRLPSTVFTRIGQPSQHIEQCPKSTADALEPSRSRWVALDAHCIRTLRFTSRQYGIQFVPSPELATSIVCTRHVPQVNITRLCESRRLVGKPPNDQLTLVTRVLVPAGSRASMDRIFLAALVLATCLLAGMIPCVKHVTVCSIHDKCNNIFAN